ncbi:alkyldihydroxyacetonephosphate synthase, peroxisomal-like [Xenia sp. Carnegie-2017]|uniref:alkyldihydroxyacetonephosphate synthase, peroxisomal-like n=1 Tax=Xenia sp. Carnegie-2017 TaxID=2897299 RepID=UPI001F03C7CA|nr:alkyldihydroxyacetonephosphate synthase, peroxisomal-like [Xenia sp. Carnegie-2017]
MEKREDGEAKQPRDNQKWNGWGYQDSKFLINSEGLAQFTGERYGISGQVFPKLVDWFVNSCSADLEFKSPSQNIPKEEELPKPIVNELFLKSVRDMGFDHSMHGHERLFRSHGHTCHEIYLLRHGKIPRLPDIVIWPRHHNEVEKVVSLANKHDVCIIPFGGGTSVSSALECPIHELRMIVSLDMTRMNKILWIDHENMTMCAEAGIIGQDLEKQLHEKGVCVGHEPDSMEFSSLGGWVATRASGMKKNIYGNIEDLLVHVKFVTAKGTMEKNCMVPRMSTGPDIHHVIMGSEGTLGVVTEVILRIQPLPEHKTYGSIVFPNFESGVECLREIAKLRCAPASIRLVDNEQFKFGQTLKPQAHSFFSSLMEGIKTIYVTRFKGYEPNKLCVATLLFQGSKTNVETQEKMVYSIAAKYGGLSAGAENGRRGYMLTFAIAYLRDLGFEYSFLAESFETCVPWDRVITLCKNTKAAIYRKCKDLGVHYKPLVTCRVTQTYDTGACVYFYFGFNYHGLADPLAVYQAIEDGARDEVIANGGSLSHHHGVGKIRKQWLPSTVSNAGYEMMNGIKKTLDPKNVFGNDNLISKL